MERRARTLNQARQLLVQASQRSQLQTSCPDTSLLPAAESHPLGAGALGSIDV